MSKSLGGRVAVRQSSWRNGRTNATLGGRSTVWQSVARVPFVVRRAQGVNDAVTAATADLVAFTQSFAYNGTDGSDGSAQPFTVPDGVTALRVEARGAKGWGYGSGGQAGLGAYVIGLVAVVAGTVLEVRVGGQPSTASGGYNGGGAGTGPGGGGGGGTDLRTSPYGLGQRLIVAAGGGGGGDFAGRGGLGGYTNGGNGLSPTSNVGGRGGTQAAGGLGQGAGSAGSLGQGGYADPGFNSGGGGGGYYGGGGGGDDGGFYHYAGGGGGSSWVVGTVFLGNAGAVNGHGSLVVTSVAAP